jgi:L-rhamnose mutarotase
MERHAFYARLAPGQEDAYIAAHRNMPRDLIAAYRRAGINNLFIFRHDDLLFLYLECEKLNAAIASLDQNPMEIQWQKLTGPMLVGGDFQKLTGIFEMP